MLPELLTVQTGHGLKSHVLPREFFLSDFLSLTPISVIPTGLKELLPLHGSCKRDLLIAYEPKVGANPVAVWSIFNFSAGFSCLSALWGTGSAAGKTRRESSFNMHTMHTKHTHACVLPEHAQDYSSATLMQLSEIRFWHGNIKYCYTNRAMNLQQVIVDAEAVGFREKFRSTVTRLWGMGRNKPQ